MEILAWAFLGGIVGAVLMDVTETYAAKVGISSGVMSLWLDVGSWACCADSSPIPTSSIQSHFLKKQKLAGYFIFLLAAG